MPPNILPSMVILHGENLLQSRKTLGQYLQQAQAKQRRIVRLEAKKLELAQLQEEVGATGLFGEPVTLIIEELHSLPTSARKTALIKELGALAATEQQEPNPSLELILYEKRQLTPTMLKQFPGAKATESKLTKALFSWLDSVTGQFKFNQTQFQQVMDQDGEMMAFTMLLRQVRLLIQVKEGQTATLAPFMVSKLKQQSGTFNLPQLLKLHHRLFELDLGQKTSTLNLPLQQELELLLTGM